MSKHSSTFTALRNSTYRRIWLASLLSSVCIGAHDTAATWVMNTLSPSAFLLSLMSTVASLPFFLFTLPAGALADMVDRRKLLRFMNLWLAVSAGVLAVLFGFHLLTPTLILICVFFTGVGFAFNAPAWASIVPEIVTNDELPSASTLSGLQFNISGIIGPALGGLALRFVSPSWVFGLNALCFLVVISAVVKWKRANEGSKLPLENFLESFATAIRYVRFAPGVQVVLVRNILFSLFICVIPALLPVVGLQKLRFEPSSLGLLFTCMGAGSVFGAVFVVPKLRDHLSSNAIIISASVLLVAVYLGMALVTDHILFMGIAAVAGIAWTLAASELWVAGQRAMPDWARGRMNATVIMVSQGAMALGGIIWGLSASMLNVTLTLEIAAGLLLLSLLLSIPFSINFVGELNFTPAPVTGSSLKLLHVPRPHDGPISITYEFEVHRSRGSEFIRLLREVRLIHLRNGAYSWRLHEDLGRANVYRIEMMMPSWTEHLLQRERYTKSERDVLEQAVALHAGENPPVERVYLCVNRELFNHVSLLSHPGTMSTSPLDLGTQEVGNTV
ncbi:MAG TPA: MFS transporter [Chthoniobacterales bacterium]|jgi:MFS family permease